MSQSHPLALSSRSLSVAVRCAMCCAVVLLDSLLGTYRLHLLVARQMFSLEPCSRCHADWPQQAFASNVMRW